MKSMSKAISLWNRGHWKDYVFSQGMLLIASLLLVFFISIGLGVGNILQRFLSSDLPEEQVRITPQGVQAGFFQTERGGTEITNAILDSLSSLPQVERIDPQIYAHVPAYLRGLLGGMNYYTDITLEGVTDAFVPDSLLAYTDWNYTLADSSTKPLPIILSENLLVLYNAGFAESNGLMGLTPDGVIGLECRVSVGTSSIASLEFPPINVRAQIIGTSRNTALFALAVPIEFVEEINNYYLPDSPHTYSALMVTAGKAEDVPEIVRYAEGLGLTAETRRGIAQKAEILVGVVIAALGALAGAILFAAVASAIHTLVADLKNRSYALGVLVALGTKRERLVTIFAFQIFLMSLLTTAAGGLLGCGLSFLVSTTLLNLLPALRVAVSSIAVFPVGWLSAGLGFVLLASTVSAWFFFRRILVTPVTELLRR
jgi:ABC-type antimicrobial peptide transport system permease subunit